MGVGPEGRHTAIRLPKSLQAFKDRLGVVEDRGAGVERKRGVRRQLGVVPPAVGVPEDAYQVLGQEAVDLIVGQESAAPAGSIAATQRGDLDTERRAQLSRR